MTGPPAEQAPGERASAAAELTAADTRIMPPDERAAVAGLLVMVGRWIDCADRRGIGRPRAAAMLHERAHVIEEAEGCDPAEACRRAAARLIVGWG